MSKTQRRERKFFQIGPTLLYVSKTHQREGERR